MLRLLVVAVAAVALAAGGDVAARRYAEGEMVDRLEAAAPTATARTAEIDSFPFLGRLVALGDVERVAVRLENVEANGLLFSAIDADLRGVRLDRSRLLQGDVELVGIDRGLVTAELGLAEVVRVAGAAFAGDVRLEDGVLVVGGVRLDLSGVPLLPCATRVGFAGTRVVVTCELDEVPDELLDEANRRAQPVTPRPA